MALGIRGCRWQLRCEMKKCKAVKDERPKDARSTRKIKPSPAPFRFCALWTNHLDMLRDIPPCPASPI